MTDTQNPLPIVRTSAGLRDVMFDELDAIRSGKSNATRASAVARLAGGIVETVRMELEVHRHLRSVPEKITANSTESPLGAPLSLGAAA